MEPVTCVACALAHIDDEDVLARSVRIGVSFVHPECAWTLRYPGMQAHEVIERLEGQLARVSEVYVQDTTGIALGTATAVDGDQATVALNGGTDPGVPVSDDPAQRVAQVDPALTGRRTIPCPVCGGDGEIATADDPPVMCGRCNGEGRVEVTGG